MSPLFVLERSNKDYPHPHPFRPTFPPNSTMYILDGQTALTDL